MKTLIIFSVILAIFAAFFIFNVEKSVSVKGGGNAIPAGVDIAEFISNQVEKIKAGDIISNLTSNDRKDKISDIIQSKIIGGIKSKIGEIKNKISKEGVDLIKKPIENKVNEMFCPKK